MVNLLLFFTNIQFEKKCSDDVTGALQKNLPKIKTIYIGFIWLFSALAVFDVYKWNHNSL